MIININFMTKEKAIEITNSYLNLVYREGTLCEVKVPIYKKKWKLWLLDKLVLYRKNRANRLGGEFEYEEGISNIDYSKIICPDSWIISHAGYVAFGVDELKYVYFMKIRNAFLLENTKYGMRPIGSYDYYLFRPYILIDKNTAEIYDLGTQLYFKDDEDFNNYKENKVSKINWSEYIKKMPDASL